MDILHLLYWDNKDLIHLEFQMILKLNQSLVALYWVDAKVSADF